MSAPVSAAQAARAALVVLDGPRAGVGAGSGDVGRAGAWGRDPVRGPFGGRADVLEVVADAEVLALARVVAAPLPAQAPRERARPLGLALAAIGLLVVGVFVALPLQVVAGTVLGVGGSALVVTAVVLAGASAGLRALLGRVCASVPLRARTMVPTGLLAGRRRTEGRRAHARDYRDREPVAP